MTTEGADSSADFASSKRGARRQKLATYFAVIVSVYRVVAYLLLPLAWRTHAHRHPQFDDDPRLTKTRDGHPGDPLNVALVGTEGEVKEIMAKAKWFPADRHVLSMPGRIT